MASVDFLTEDQLELGMQIATGILGFVDTGILPSRVRMPQQLFTVDLGRICLPATYVNLQYTNRPTPKAPLLR